MTWPLVRFRRTMLIVEPRRVELLTLLVSICVCCVGTFDDPLTFKA